MTLTMKKGVLFSYSKLSRDFKLATVLLIDAMPVYFTVRMTAANQADTDFVDYSLMVMYFFFLIFNAWALIAYYLTKLIKRLWLRDALFYLSALAPFFAFTCIWSVCWSKALSFLDHYISGK